MKKYNRVIRKINRDHAKFKKDMLTLSIGGVYDSAYEICTVEEIYNLLIYAYEFTDEELRIVLSFKGNILEQIYDEWLDSSHSCHDELADSINTTLSRLRKRDQS